MVVIPAAYASHVKTCKVCRETKPLDAFYANKGGRDRRRPDCKACHLARRRESYRANPEKYIERVQRWQRENPERYKAKLAEYAASGKKKISDRKSYLKRTYGISLEEYDAMLAAQGGGCAICGSPGRDYISLHVDHDHETGDIRGLLCFTCNNALGDLGDSFERMLRAAEYLDRDDELAAAARERAVALATG